MRRVSGGVPTIRGDFPWTVLIRHIDGRYCGGSLVSELYVLTAANCVDRGRKTTDLRVRLGSRKLSTQNQDVVDRSVDSIDIHDNWKGNVTVDDNIALLKLSEPVTFNSFIQPVNLAPANFTIDEKQAWVTGNDTSSAISSSTFFCNKINNLFN